MALAIINRASGKSKPQSTVWIPKSFGVSPNGFASVKTGAGMSN
jgi:hypothetical protein